MSILLFNRWGVEGVTVRDLGIRDYMVIEPKIVPKTGARYAGMKFHKSKIFIVERLINKLMVPGHKGKKHWRSSGHITGKKEHAMRTVERAFEIVEHKLHKNPLEVFIVGLENACAREEIVTIEYGGARYPKAVEVAPQRRIDIALRMMVQGSYARSFRSRLPVEQALAEEIMGAYQNSSKSSAVSKKRDLERQAASAK